MLLPDCTELHFQYDEALHLLRSAWTGIGTVADLRVCAERLLAVLQAKHIRHYLMELDALDDIPVEEQLWLGTDWLPRLRPLPLRRVALLISERRLHNKMAIDALMEQGMGDFAFEVQFFVDPRNAMRWLTNDSPRVPELLAEWDESFQRVAVPSAMHRVLGRPGSPPR